MEKGKHTPSKRVEIIPEQYGENNCSCYIRYVSPNSTGHTIMLCPLHGAAPKMLEALKKAEPYLENQFPFIALAAQKAIAKAEGRE